MQQVSEQCHVIKLAGHSNLLKDNQACEETCMANLQYGLKSVENKDNVVLSVNNIYRGSGDSE